VTAGEGRGGRRRGPGPPAARTPGARAHGHTARTTASRPDGSPHTQPEARGREAPNPPTPPSETSPTSETEPAPIQVVSCVHSTAPEPARGTASLAAVDGIPHHDGDVDASRQGRRRRCRP
jgi:hypothetical protein